MFTSDIGLSVRELQKTLEQTPPNSPERSFLQFLVQLTSEQLINSEYSAKALLSVIRQQADLKDTTRLVFPGPIAKLLSLDDKVFREAEPDILVRDLNEFISLLAQVEYHPVEDDTWEGEDQYRTSLFPLITEDIRGSDLPGIISHLGDFLESGDIDSLAPEPRLILEKSLEGLRYLHHTCLEPYGNIPASFATKISGQNPCQVIRLKGTPLVFPSLEMAHRYIASILTFPTKSQGLSGQYLKEHLHPLLTRICSQTQSVPVITHVLRQNYSGDIHLSLPVAILTASQEPLSPINQNTMGHLRIEEWQETCPGDNYPIYLRLQTFPERSTSS